jgi:hypothetical protein
MSYIPLEASIIDSVIAEYARYIHDDSLTPGIIGKKVFLETVLDRDNFLPKPIQDEIDKNKGVMDQREYLLRHPQLYEQFGCYLP